jgi:hypothetical protein
MEPVLPPKLVHSHLMPQNPIDREFKAKGTLVPKVSNRQTTEGVQRIGKTQAVNTRTRTQSYVSGSFCSHGSGEWRRSWSCFLSASFKAKTAGRSLDGLVRSQRVVTRGGGLCPDRLLCQGGTRTRVESSPLVGQHIPLCPVPFPLLGHLSVLTELWTLSRGS